MGDLAVVVVEGDGVGVEHFPFSTQPDLMSHASYHQVYNQRKKGEIDRSSPLNSLGTTH